MAQNRIAANGVETRERILIEASRLLAMNGYHGTTTRQIAAAVGISQPSLFFHFPNKRELVKVLYEFDIVPAVAGLKNLIAGPGDPAAKLYAMLVGELRRIIDSPYDMRAHLSFEALSHPDLAEFRDLVDQFDQLTLQLIVAGQQEAQFVGDDAWLAQQMVAGFLARANLFATHSRVERQSHPEEAAGLVLRSLLIDPTSLEAVRDRGGELIDRFLNPD